LGLKAGEGVFCVDGQTQDQRGACDKDGESNGAQPAGDEYAQGGDHGRVENAVNDHLKSCVPLTVRLKQPEREQACEDDAVLIMR
jgi:hypothetical protein